MSVFPFDLYATEAQSSKEALIDATKNLAVAMAGHKAAVIKLEEFTESMNVGDETKLAKATAVVATHQAVLDRATKAHKTAERGLLNSDCDLAEALRPMASRLAVGPTTILCVPAPLQELPSMSDFVPVLVLQQQTAAFHSGNGSLAASSGARISKTPQSAILLTYYSHAELHQPLTGLDVHNAALATGVAIDGTINDMRPRVTHIGNVRVQVFKVYVIAAYPAIPTVETIDLGTFGASVPMSVRGAFRSLGDRGASAEGHAEIVSSDLSGDTRHLTVDVRFAYETVLGDHSEQLPVVTTAISRWAGRAYPNLGRIRSAELVSEGEKIKAGSAWGRMKVHARFVVASYVPESQPEAA